MKAGINVVRKLSDEISLTGWINLDNSQTTAIALEDSDGSALTATVKLSVDPGNFSGDGSASAGSGDLAWAAAGTLVGTVAAPVSVIFENLPDGLYTVRASASAPLSDTDISGFAINGSAVQQVQVSPAGAPNTTQSAAFIDISPTGGVITVDVTSAQDIGGLSVLEIESAPSPSLTVTQTELTPGDTISGTYADYETVPTTLTVSDGTNTITIASPTINDNGDGTGDFSGTMPELPTSGTANLVLFGDVTVELT